MNTDEQTYFHLNRIPCHILRLVCKIIVNVIFVCAVDRSFDNILSASLTATTLLSQRTIKQTDRHTFRQTFRVTAAD